MRIALITSSFLPVVGGLEWKVHYLATEYAAAGHEAVVFAPRPGRRHRRAVVAELKGYRVVRCGYPAPGMGRLGIAAWLLRRAMNRENRKSPFDVIHCHPLGLSSQVGADVAEGTRAVVVATTSGGDLAVQSELGFGNRLSPAVDRMVRDSAARMDAIVAVSRAMRQAVEALNVKTRIVDIPNGVAWDEFQMGRSGWLRERLGIAGESLIVLSVGRSVPVKNYRRAMTAFGLALKTLPGASYVIVGRDVPMLAETSEARSLGANLHLVDQQPMTELPSIFHSADVFFNPSLSEGFSQVNAQALACGLPMVITDAPGNVDAGDHGGALIARATDPNDMGQKLFEVLSDRGRRAELARAAHVAGRRYSWKTIAAAYLSLFGELIAARNTARVAGA